MKKLLYALIIPLLFISKVHALDNAYVSNFYNNFETFSSIDSTIINNLITYYNNNFSSTYNYYFIYLDNNNNTVRLSATNLNNVYFDGNYFGLVHGSAASGISYRYSFITNTYQEEGFASIWDNMLYSTNLDFIFNDSSTCGVYQPTQNCYDSLTIPSYSNISLDVSYPQLDIDDGDIIPTYLSLVNGPTADFTEVNLSDYEYIVLSLKDYSQSPFNTTIYSLGSLCFTPVYNYGMTQKNEIFTGYQTMGCTESYTSITPVSIYIIQSDLDNHAVFYIKKSNSSTNIIKIPTSVFDITYITSENVNDPQVVIGGRSYPVIPFNDLTDTANKSTDEGYISGQVCSLGDVNCQATQNGMDISELFTQPLQVLKTLWGSITNVFMLITTFIGLLPITLQAFLYSAFMLAIVLGILKIIL